MSKTKEIYEYETIASNGSTYKYVDDGNWVTLSVNGKEWGASDGDRFIRALLRDVLNLSKEETSNDIYSCMCNLEGGGMDCSFVRAKDELHAQQIYKDYLDKAGKKPNSYWTRDGFAVSKIYLINE